MLQPRRLAVVLPRTMEKDRNHYFVIKQRNTESDNRHRHTVHTTQYTQRYNFTWSSISTVTTLLDWTDLYLQHFIEWLQQGTIQGKVP